MHLPRLGKNAIAIMLFSFSMIVVFSGAVKAERMTSTNYVIQQDALGIGGNTSSSTNYVATDTIGEMASGEGLSSTNYQACSGFECFPSDPFITLTVRQGTSVPGTSGAGVALGTLSTSSVQTSNGTTINSIFLTAATNAPSGLVTSVRGLNGGLRRTSVPTDVITSGSATLVAGTAGYGVCVFSNTQAASSATSYAKAAPYNGTCTKTTGHAVGIVDTTTRTILSSTGALSGGESEVLVKAAISAATPVGSDYADTLTFIATGTY
jgi:hypothetical protein